MCEFICRCISGVYKGLEFKFMAKDIMKYDYTNVYNIAFKDLRQASDFIIKFFLNAYEEVRVDLSLNGTFCTIQSSSIELEKVVI